VPDLIAFAKAVTQRIRAAGRVLVSERIAATFKTRAFPGGLTYSGHPLATAAAVANIAGVDRRQADRERRSARPRGARPRVARAGGQQPAGRRGARGSGAFWAVELVRDQATREPPGAGPAPPGRRTRRWPRWPPPAGARGLVPFINGSRTHVVPPLNITDEEARYGLALLGEALAEVAAGL